MTVNTLESIYGQESSFGDNRRQRGIAGASLAKVSEIQKYVEDVQENAKEFAEKSNADKKAKDRKPLKTKTNSQGGRWITKDSRHIPLED